MAQKDQQVKDQQITVRVSKEEKREIERRASAAGRSVSRYLAESGLSDEQQMSAEGREALAEELGDLYEEIRSIGGNVNQIARRVNQGKPVPSEAIQRAGKAVEQASDAIIERLEEATV